MDGVTDAVLVADGGGRIRAMNEAAERLLGSSAERVVGRSIEDVVTGKTNDGIPLASWLASGAGSVSTSAVIGEQRTPVVVSVTRPGSDDLICVLRDLRSVRALERMKREFLATVGHELRTPLTSAFGFARLLRDRRLSPEQQSAFAQAVVQACEKLSRVIDQLIDVATIEGGVAPVPSDAVDVARLTRGVVDAWGRFATTHVFALDIQGSVPLVVGSEALLRRAIYELVDNAVKFSPGGGVVTVSLRQVRPGRVAIVVSDQGIGIEPATAETMFDDFTQADPSETRRFGGLGIGLGFVRRVAKLHEGSIDVASVPDHGTTVRMELRALLLDDDGSPRAREAKHQRASGS